jgi:protein phosphatase
MGGHAGGEVASKLCVQSISDYKDVDQSHDGEQPNNKLMNSLAEAVNFASTKIYERALEEPTLKGMGTTATVARIADPWCYIAHVGDSRCYLVRQGVIYQLTNDHSLVHEQVRAGILSKEEAEHHHLRNVITRSVGYQEQEDVDTSAVQLEDQDYLLLCSDGLHGKLTDEELSLAVQKDGLGSVEKLIALANARGGEDNITIVIVHVEISP